MIRSFRATGQKRSTIKTPIKNLYITGSAWEIDTVCVMTDSFLEVILYVAHDTQIISSKSVCSFTILSGGAKTTITLSINRRPRRADGAVVKDIMLQC